MTAPACPNSGKKGLRGRVIRDFDDDEGLGQTRANQDMGFGGYPPRPNGKKKGYGIDLSKPVTVKEIPPPDQVHQYVGKHGYPGNFFDGKGGQTPNELGINGDPTRRQLKTFDVPATTPKRNALESGNGRFVDDWTDRNNWGSNQP